METSQFKPSILGLATPMLSIGRSTADAGDIVFCFLYTTSTSSAILHNHRDHYHHLYLHHHLLLLPSHRHLSSGSRHSPGGNSICFPPFPVSHVYFFVGGG